MPGVGLEPTGKSSLRDLEAGRQIFGYSEAWLLLSISASPSKRLEPCFVLGTGASIFPRRFHPLLPSPGIPFPRRCG